MLKINKLCVSFLAFALAVAVVLGTTTTTVYAQAFGTALGSEADDQVVNLINAQRAVAGVQPLAVNPALSQLATRRAIELANHIDVISTGNPNIFMMTQHQKADREPIGDWITREAQLLGWHINGNGENITAGAPVFAGSAVLAHDRWVESPPHFEALMHPEFTLTGVGHARSAGGHVFWVQLFGGSARDVNTFTLAEFRAMASAHGPLASLTSDNLNSAGGVDVRVSFRPGQATQGISLTASTFSPRAVAAQNVFRTHLNTVSTVVSFQQQGGLGMEVGVAVRLAPGMNTNNLFFYSYNPSANTFSVLEPGNVSVDANGFVHFATSIGGDIVITNSAVSGGR